MQPAGHCASVDSTVCRTSVQRCWLLAVAQLTMLLAAHTSSVLLLSLHVWAGCTAMYAEAMLALIPAVLTMQAGIANAQALWAAARRLQHHSPLRVVCLHATLCI